MRLIDADAYKAHIIRSAEVNGSDLTFSKILCQSIDERPTAYDVDKVVERLEVNSMFAQEDDEPFVMLEDVLQIVKSGGVADE